MNNQEEDAKLAKQIFGSTNSKIKATGGHRVKFEEFFKSFEWEESVMRTFCEGCGTYMEINEKLARKYATAADIKLPANPEKFYFHSQGCIFCDSPNSEVKLVPLPNA